MGRRPGSILLGAGLVGAMTVSVAAPASAAVFKVTQQWSATSVNEGVPVNVLYSWPGGGAKVTTNWNDGKVEVHQTPLNYRSLTHVYSVPCNVAIKTFVVYTTVAKGSGDAGSAAIHITARRVGPACT